MSHVPDEILPINSTLPPVTPTFQTKLVVGAFKSVDDMSVNVADNVSQVA